MRKPFHIFYKKEYDAKTLKNLIKILDKEKIEYDDEKDSIVIKTTLTKCEKLFRTAIENAHREDGVVIRVRKVIETDVWVPASEAKSWRTAVRKAVKKVKTKFKNGNMSKTRTRYEYSIYIKDSWGDGMDTWNEEWQIKYLDNENLYR